MNRSDLAALVNPLPTVQPSLARATLAVANPVRDALVAYFASPQGKADLADAPRVNGRQVTAQEAVDALVEEARGL